MTELHKELSFAELFGTNPLFRITYPFYFPNDFDILCCRGNRQVHSSHCSLLLNCRTPSATKAKDNLVKMKIKPELEEKVQEQGRIEKESIVWERQEL